ncbi:disulfide bond formation protein B [Aurantivibrio plasticivorans]
MYLIVALPSIRLTNLALALICAGLMAYAFYSEKVLGLHPCPLCMSQRFFVVLVGALALIAFAHNPKSWGVKLYAALGVIATVGGGIVAGRHLWIQSLPEDQVPACGPSLEYILDTFPLGDALMVLFRGDGNCAEVTWEFLGLSMPAWVLIAFVGLGFANLWQMLRKTAA